MNWPRNSINIHFSSYNTKNMIEMDQFVATLSGIQSEIIERRSWESAATMKDLGKTIKKFDFFCQLMLQ